MNVFRVQRLTSGQQGEATIFESYYGVVSASQAHLIDY